MQPSHKVWNEHHPDDPIYDDCIHHINGDHSDNRIENLQKMTKGDHIRLHQKDVPKDNFQLGLKRSDDTKAILAEQKRAQWADPVYRERMLKKLADARANTQRGPGGRYGSR